MEMTSLLGTSLLPSTPWPWWKRSSRNLDRQGSCRGGNFPWDTGSCWRCPCRSRPGTAHRRRHRSPPDIGRPRIRSFGRGSPCPGAPQCPTWSFYKAKKRHSHIKSSLPNWDETSSTIFWFSISHWLPLQPWGIIMQKKSPTLLISTTLE